MNALDLIYNGNDDAADEMLKKEGFKLRLSSNVLCYEHVTDDSIPCPVAVCYDHVLDHATISKLQIFLSKDGAYFKEHNYFSKPGPGYFSYCYDLGCPDDTLIEAVVLKCQKVLSKDFPEIKEAKMIEVWAHNRPHSKGHQLHFDSDDEGVGGVRNPIVSMILYLSHDVGGPTCVTEQTLTDGIATHGWLIAPPKEEGNIGRIAAFRGNVLHGVVRGCPREDISDNDESKRRVTLMIAFWRDVKIRPSLSEQPGSCRPLPVSGKYSWVNEIKMSKNESLDMKCNPTKVKPKFVKPFFKTLDENLKKFPDYEELFQGEEKH